MKNVYERLALTDEQQGILKEFQAAYEKMCRAHIGLVNTFCNGIYVFNSEEVNCFNAPKNAAYDTDKHEIDIAKLQLVFNHSFKNVHELGMFETCLVVFDED